MVIFAVLYGQMQNLTQSIQTQMKKAMFYRENERSLS